MPINYPTSDDPGAGILTSNYVSKVDKCDGLCTQNIPIGPEPLPDTGPGDIPFPNKPGNNLPKNAPKVLEMNGSKRAKEIFVNI